MEMDEVAPLTSLSAWDQSLLRERSINSNLWLGEGREVEEAALAKGYSLRRALLAEVSRAAMEWTAAQGGTCRLYEETMQQGANIVVELQGSVTKDRWNDDAKPNWNFWQHHRDPGALIVKGKAPDIDRESVLNAADDYLALPYRSPRLERTLVDMLVATEMFAFGEEMFRPIPAALRWLPVRSPIQQRHALLRHLIQLFWSAVILLGTAAAAQWLLPGLIGPTPTDWVSGISVGVFCVLAIVDTALLPFAWRYQANERAKVRSLMLKMTATYGELADNGVVS